MFSDDSETPSGETYKRRAYLVALPLGALACILAILLTPVMSLFARASLGVFAGVLASFTVAFRLNQRSFRQLELGLYVTLGISFLLSLSYLFWVGLRTPHPSPAPLAYVGYWLPVFYASTFLIFGAQRGRKISVIAFVTTFLLSFVYAGMVLLRGGSAGDLLALLQLHLAGAVLILTFIIFTKLTEVHTGLASTMAYLANTDSLTKINNRRRLERLLREEIDRAERYRSRFSVLLMDVDHFKSVNDRYGHNAGDQCLRELAGLLHNGVRSVDYVGRWGGEEFLVIVPESGLQEAGILAQRLKASVATTRFGPGLALTASFGVATYQRGDTVEMLIQRADTALYEAKQAGRNTVVLELGEQ